MSKFTLTIPTLLGTEQVVAFEVKELGYEISKVDNGSVSFVGDEEAIAVLNINLRAAERVMINLRPSNIKLRDRMIRIVVEITGTDYADAERLLEENGFVIRDAVAAFKK